MSFQGKSAKMSCLKTGFFKKEVFLWTVFFAAFLIRMSVILVLPEKYKIIKSDSIGYDQMATNIVAGRGLSSDVSKDLPPIPTSARMPLYPLFLAVIYYLFGHSFFAVRAVQSLIGAALCLIIYFIAKKIYNNNIAILAAILAIIYKPFVYHAYYGGPNFLLTENLFVFTCAVFILSLIKYLEKPSYFSQAICGITLALSYLTRAEIFLFPLFLLFYLAVLYKFKIKILFKRTFIIFLIFFTTMFVWGLRNYYAQKKWIFTTTLGGVFFYAGNNTLTKGGVMVLKNIPEYDSNIYGNLNEVEKDKACFNLGLDFWKNNPQRLPKLFFRKLMVHWSFFENEGGYNIFYGTLLPFILMGLWFSFLYNRSQGFLVVLLLFFYSNLLVMITAGDPRYRYHLEPYLVILASSGLFYLGRILKNRFLLVFLALALFLLNLVIWYFWPNIYGYLSGIF